MWDNDLLKQNPELKFANQYQQEHENRVRENRARRQGGGGGILQSISQISAAVGQVMALAQWGRSIGRSIPPGVGSILYFYLSAPFGIAMACLWFWWAIATAKGGFFNLGLGWGTFDALLFFIGAAIGGKTLQRMYQVFRGMNWMTKIVALFFFYSLAIWWNHRETDGAWGPVAEAFFFCIIVSLFIERFTPFLEEKTTLLATRLLS